MNSCIKLVPSGDDEGEYTKEFKASLLQAISDVRYGRIHSFNEIKKI
ncbi:hypothetical protein KAW38_04455 [Candidatus Micrarchaeota archaeon]|nr:hypothetical protein [Candidatus Micrarchaeota archaeon]